MPTALEVELTHKGYPKLSAGTQHACVACQDSTFDTQPSPYNPQFKLEQLPKALLSIISPQSHHRYLRGLIAFVSSLDILLGCVILSDILNDFLLCII